MYKEYKEMKKIREVPSKVFHQSLDRWLDRSMEYKLLIECSYCKLFRLKKCPLNNKAICDNLDNCCNGLWKDYINVLFTDNTAANKIADKIADLIIDRCVYEVNE